MWNIIIILILIIEVLMLLRFIVGRFQKRRLNETAVFVGVVFALNMSLYFVPFLYKVIELGEESNYILGFIGCIGPSIKLFVGEAKVEMVTSFAKEFVLFPFTFMIGVIVAMLTTITATVEAFSNSIVSAFRLAKALKKDTCDIVVGNSSKALHYVKNCNAVLLLDDSVGKASVKELIEDGYAVMRKDFTVRLLKSWYLNTSTRYNIVCPDSEKALNYIDTFIAYKKVEEKAKNIYLYVEMEGDRAETIRREIIEKSGMEAYIDTFSINELVARTFTEENPVTKYLPDIYIEDAAIKQGTQINVFILGFGKLGQELYRQSVLNNQLVTFDGEYKELPVNYYLCDTNIDATEWNIGGLSEALSELNATEYFPLPEIPFKTTVIDKAPASYKVLTAIKAQVQKENSYTLVIVDTEEDCHNIEIGARLKTALIEQNNYHIFVRSEAAYIQSDEIVSYFGKSNSVFNHDVIVNDSLSTMAKKLNEVYTAQYAGEEERNRSDFKEYIQKKAEKDWEKLDYFTLYSNIYSAMNLRVKLNLLGLDYTKDGKSANIELINERHRHKEEYAYNEYFNLSVRNALIAQEHARWNAYHLLYEYLPLSKNSINVKSDDGKKVRFNVKNTEAKKHACLTTFKGLNDLSSYLAQKAGNGCSAADYDYYIYDEMLITSADELLSSLGYSIIEK
ncbi:MAG: hypothetical protein E7480_00215 [Ruminococcaceae bacterium]|nr:hypothetical protein [Oscillospiraceae bacterium]